ncbi:hypothetical protein [Amycolatopsis australiensis]|uniref:DUF3800 domain-containing protein n=1 Tax=Amycolatopsis australiensis TaxID=546364 RepID=A0A1K1LM95_9PSEU|nr:hypothetical protein [Amycolatopsis australiensis]SFW12004.1 hypothetical protein SAMN04489730_0079 [Amycolatopsis australiensis]
MSVLQAFADESFHEDDGGGFYVLAAAVLPADRHAELRQLMLDLRGPRSGKLHWQVLTEVQRRDAAKRVADFDELHFVAVGSPVPVRRQERGRALCLQRLVAELHGVGVEHLVAEGRTVQLNARDVRTVQQARFMLPKGARFRLDHMLGVDEPLLWVSDIVAGAVRARLHGNETFFEPLADCVLELQVGTRT